MFLLVVILSFVGIFSMPYNVPLQGESGGKKTLVVMDNLANKPVYSIFFEDLITRGHNLHYFQSDAEDLILKRFGDYLYDNIVFLAPSVERFHEISFDDFVEFVKSGRNLLLAADKNMSDEFREFVASFGASFDRTGMDVIDHFEREIGADVSLQDTVFWAKHGVNSSVILDELNGKLSVNPVLFKGVAHKLSSDNVLAVPILWGNPSSYIRSVSNSVETKTISLVSSLQGRNNARVIISGSLDLFSNKFFNYRATATNEISGNRKFCSAVSAWGFRETGILRFRNITHHKVDGTPPDVILHEKERPDLPVTLYPDPEITRNSLVYRIKDEIVYSMVVEEYNNGVWLPFSTNDMQLEFVMLDPHVRKTMNCDNNGKFIATFVAPDNYGIFKFRVLYRRAGYTVIHAETQVSIRPFKHNEYERFILSAFPYYASAFSAIIGFFIFALLFLFSS